MQVHPSKLRRINMDLIDKLIVLLNTYQSLSALQCYSLVAVVILLLTYSPPP